jgi:hypothetical protein
MGKNYTGNNKGRNIERYTPWSMTYQFLEQHKEIDFNGSVLEPCCGEKAIVKILQIYFLNKDKIFFYDIKDGNKDFLLNEVDKYDYIITNFPFKKINKFILKAFDNCTKQVCILFKTDFLSGIERYLTVYNNNKNFKLKYVYEFVRKPLLENNIREDGKYKTGIEAYAWAVFENGYVGEPIIRWINNNQWIARKK